MPLYMLRFRVETCLSRQEDFEIDFIGCHSVFLFSKKTNQDKHVVAEIKIEAANNREAWNHAAGILLPPILDALPFATGTPLLLRDCELILKDESGSPARHAIYVGHRRVPSVVNLGNVEIEEAKKILSDGGDLRLPLCWHRYALDRELAHEQFVFNWLAFEALAGDTDVMTRCPKCQAEVQHCGSLISHRGSSKVAARAIFKAAHPDTTDQDFNNRIWSKARNSVFHGRRYPKPEYLSKLHTTSTKLHTAVDKRIDEALQLGNRNRPHDRYERWYRHFVFAEWTTQDQSVAFATDWPAKHFADMSAEDSPGAAHQTAETAGITILNYETDSVGW